jgi:hypothetical protein
MEGDVIRVKTRNEIVRSSVKADAMVAAMSQRPFVTQRVLVGLKCFFNVSHARCLFS